MGNSNDHSEIPNDNDNNSSNNLTGVEDQDEEQLQLSLSSPSSSSSSRPTGHILPPQPRPNSPPQPPALPLHPLFTQSPPQSALQLSPSHPIYRLPLNNNHNPQPFYTRPATPQPIINTDPVIVTANPVVVAASSVTNPVVVAANPVTNPVIVAANPVTNPVAVAANLVTNNPVVVSANPVVVSTNSQKRQYKSQALRNGKNITVPPPFPWATDLRAKLHNLNYLQSNQITTISGEVQCKRCDKQYKIEFNLKQKFHQVASYICSNDHILHDRAPDHWIHPVLPPCKFCQQEKSVKPIISTSKKTINWLFLFLGEMIGCCTLEQLKYFCKHTQNHRTGAKDRLLYLTYLTLCRQLEPKAMFGYRF